MEVPYEKIGVFLEPTKLIKKQADIRLFLETNPPSHSRYGMIGKANP